jgi:hypothetical protein
MQRRQSLLHFHFPTGRGSGVEQVPLSAKQLERSTRSPLELLDDVPSTWNGPHVGRRLCEAMVTLKDLPMGRGTATSAWPAYCYEWEDLLAQ